MVRVTKLNGIIMIIDYALPKNKIGEYLISRFIEQGFTWSGIEALIQKIGIQIKKEYSTLFGAGRILKGIKVGR